MTIAAVLQGKGSSIETIAGDASLSRSGEAHSARNGSEPFPLVEDGRIVGIVSERDVIYCLRDHGPAALDQPVSRAMSPPAITVDSETGVLGAGAHNGAPNSASAGCRWGEDPRHRIDRRPCEIPHGNDRSGGRSDARLHSERLISGLG